VMLPINLFVFRSSYNARACIAEDFVYDCLQVAILSNLSTHN